MFTDGSSFGFVSPALTLLTLFPSLLTFYLLTDLLILTPTPPSYLTIGPVLVSVPVSYTHLTLPTILRV